MTTGIGYGKVILFGEHFVVYGIPAIALGIANKAIVEIKKAPQNEFVSDMPGTIPEYTLRAIDFVLKAMNLKDKFHVHLKGDLPTVGGLGSSAAFCVALVRAFASYYDLSLRDKQVNDYAYEGEKAFHGNPSGVDNTVAVYGGAIKFIRTKGFEKLKVGTPLHIVVAMTGISSPTAKMVEEVRKLKEDDEDEFRAFCDEAGELVKKGEKVVSSGDLVEIGRLMNENHKLLGAIGVTIEKNDIIVKVALDAGALGAKLTGGGGGGCCIALAKDEKSANTILLAIKKTGFDGFCTTVGL